MNSIVHIGKRFVLSFSSFRHFSCFSNQIHMDRFNGEGIGNGFGPIEETFSRTSKSSNFVSISDEKSGFVETTDSIGDGDDDNGYKFSRKTRKSFGFHSSLDEKSGISGSIDSIGNDDKMYDRHEYFDSRKVLDLDYIWDKNPYFAESIDYTGNDCDDYDRQFSTKRGFIESTRVNAERVLEILHQDGPGFDTRSALDELNLRVSGLLVREVLLGILKSSNQGNKKRCARLGFKFFVWCRDKENFSHTVSSYHMMMKIFAESGEFKPMWRLLDDMTENGFPTTARTFNILICACGEAGLMRRVVERFIKSKTFNYRPFKHSFNAILHSLIVISQYKLIEWVYQQMLVDGYSPDVLTYNIVMCAKYRLGQLDQFHRLLDEMSRNGFSPDFHTFNLLLHVLGKGDKPLAALNLLNHMKEVGCDPCILHFTTLIDGLSRAGNLDACKYFFDEMIKQGLVPDVVSYTVMITGYIVARDFSNAQQMFDEMIVKGQLPNVFTYNSMIRGLCMEGKYDDACSMLKEMESRGCIPNFLVYNTLVGNLRNAGKLSEAHKVIRRMMEKGRYVHLVSMLRGYRRC